VDETAHRSIRLFLAASAALAKFNVRCGIWSSTYLYVRRLPPGRAVASAVASAVAAVAVAVAAVASAVATAAAVAAAAVAAAAVAAASERRA